MIAPKAATPGGASRATLGGRVRGDSKLHFFDALRPSLRDGTYFLHARPELEVAGAQRLGEAEAASWQFTVRGPRFALPGGIVASSYPPAGAVDVSPQILPHVVVARPTLPWERSGEAGDTGEDDALPWLAVIVVPSGIDHEENTRQPDEALLKELGAARDGTETGGRDVRVLKFEPADLVRLLPERRESIRLGCHVRSLDSADARDGRAIVVASCTIADGPGRYSAHLVSVEGLYGTDSKADDEASDLHLPQPADDGRIPLVSLHKWEFTVTPRDHGSFDKVLHKIDARVLGMNGHDAEALADLSAERAAIASGARVLRHWLRTGEETWSWYRGPLVGTERSIPDLAFPHPARNADELLLVDRATGMIDASYAAAWELGRLTLLSRPKVARALAAWKRARIHGERCRECCDAMSDMPGCPDSADFPGCDATFPKDFFADDLHRLTAVPFAYLVPDPDMLPAESLRRFVLDPVWMRCLTDGAFSLGRATQRDFDMDCDRCGPDGPAVLRHEGTVSGILLRSVAVSDWPDMLVDAHEPGGAELEILRAERIAPGVLFALFAGKLARLTLHLHPQALHFDTEQIHDDPVELARLPALPDSRAPGIADLTEAYLSGTPSVTFSIGEAE